MVTKTTAGYRGQRGGKVEDTSVARLERRGPQNEGQEPLGAAMPEVSIDWGHYVESRLHDFQRR